MFFQELKDYLLVELGLPDDDKQTLLRVVLVLDAMAAAQLAIPSWPYYFEQEMDPQICTKEEQSLA